MAIAVLATITLASPVSAEPADSSTDRALTVTVSVDDRRVVPIGIDHGAEWGDVILETGTAIAPGLGEGSYVRRGIAFGSQRLGTQDTIQMSFASGSLVFQSAGLWYGPESAALLGGTGAFHGARGEADITVGDGTSEWLITVLPAAGVDPARATVLEYPRELVSTSRIELAPPGSTLGNLTQTTGVLKDVDTVAADYSAISTVVQDMPDNRERRAVQAMFEFVDGSIMVNAMIVAQRGALPTAPISYAISGGTGAYVGAAGVADYLPAAGGMPDRWRFTIFGRTATPTPVAVKSALQVENRFTRVRTSGTASGGIGDLILAGGWTRTGEAPRDHWAVSAQSVIFENPGTARERHVVLSTLQYNSGSDRLLVLGLSRTAVGGGPSAPVERVVIGGIGEYAGASGTATMTPLKARQWRTTFDIAR